MIDNETKMLRLMRLIASPEKTLSSNFLGEMEMGRKAALETLESLIHKGKCRKIKGVNYFTIELLEGK